MQDYFEYIDDYIEGKLSAEDQALFAHQLRKDSSLETAVKNYHDAKKLSEGLLEADMLDTLDKLDKKGMLGKNSQEHSRRRWSVLFVLLAAISLLTWWLTTQKNSNLNKDQILASYIKPIDYAAFQKGKYFFALNNFKESEYWLKDYISKEKNKKGLSEGYNWLGAVHLELWNVSDAKKAWGKSEEKEAVENLKLFN